MKKVVFVACELLVGDAVIRGKNKKVNIVLHKFFYVAHISCPQRKYPTTFEKKNHGAFLLISLLFNCL